MTLPPEDVLAHAVGADSPDPVEALELAVLPLGSELRAAIHDLRTLVPLHEATPQYRADIARLRNLLAEIARDSGTFVDMIDNAFRLAAKAIGADQLATTEGVVEIKRPAGIWKVDAGALQKRLLELVVIGGISEAEIEQVFTTTVETKADNTRLNYLARHRGDAVKDVIDEHRTYIEPSDFAGKVNYLKSDK
jgi:hypothetical protein